MIIREVVVFNNGTGKMLTHQPLNKEVITNDDLKALEKEQRKKYEDEYIDELEYKVINGEEVKNIEVLFITAEKLEDDEFKKLLLKRNLNPGSLKKY